ncbi:MAG: riboflavin biosynthesis protein RibF [Bacteroidaceae bacterium]|nr:riboflavin biosynthesis protein RibF [Bacteroidaceae bacterium]
MNVFAAIGFFDGVHQGHRYLLWQLQQAAAASGAVTMAVTFRDHPRTVLDPAFRPTLLTTTDERVALLREAGAERVEVLDFTPEMARLTAAEFMEHVLLPLGVRGLLMGFNHRFGSDRTTTFADTQAAGHRLGISVGRALPLEAGEDVSSSAIRRCVTAGLLDEASAMLGHHYSVAGDVVAGRQIGRTMGFPTANVAAPADKLLPGNGVYAAWAKGDSLPQPVAAVVNIGTRPTVEAHGRRTVEAHLIGFSGDLYGQRLTLDFVHKQRDEQRFHSREQLQRRIEADVELCKSILMQ